MTQLQIRRHMTMADELKVSLVARGEGGFTWYYMRYGRDMLRWKVPAGNITWEQKREAFIARHLPQYKANPTDRRLHALMMWGYDPRDETSRM